VTSKGEVEGSDDYDRQATRAHTVPRRPRCQPDHASRPPPTIVRRHARHLIWATHRAMLRGHGGVPDTEAWETGTLTTFQPSRSRQCTEHFSGRVTDASANVRRRHTVLKRTAPRAHNIPSARGAKSQAHHGPLQRLLDGWRTREPQDLDRPNRKADTRKGQS
jgi:hypothetical protein